MALSSFRYREIDSVDYGLIIESYPTINGAELRAERVVVPGRDGTLVNTDGTYSDIELLYNVSFLSPNRDVEDISRQIKAWLLGGKGLSIISDTYDPFYFRVGTYSGPVSIENILNRAGKLAVKFTTDPFKYSFDGQEKVEISKATSIYNPFLFDAKPYLKIYGDGKASIAINNSTISINSMTEFLEIDCELMQVYKGLENKNSSVLITDFPSLQIGENNISWTSGITKIEVIPRWRTL